MLLLYRAPSLCLQKLVPPDCGGWGGVSLWTESTPTPYPSASIQNTTNFPFHQPALCITFPGGSVIKNPSANSGDARDAGLITGLGRLPGDEGGNPLQDSCLGKSMDREPACLQFMGSQSQTQLSTHARPLIGF